MDQEVPETPRFSLEHYELDRVPGETDEEYAARRAMFENLGPAADDESSECDDDREFEMLAGDRTALEDFTENHEQIVANIVGALKPAMDRIGCRTYVRMAVRRDEESRETELRPDILVRRGPIGDRTYIDDPIVVIEVMSPESKSRDERLKHSYYWNLPTIRHILLVDAERMAVQHDAQTEGGYDRLNLADAEAVIDLTAVGFSMSLKDIYSESMAG
ncbi:Uma2 family endonuclease [Bradyrhizobium sp. Ai1a-2]|uniref:Uma2 family endonuclease n=1 Tax=Bradyrhizobium sp. Ai1a-2 TaxID=196490 RepID=UPI000684073F|nr:Uma2 family endonuclease [Bradyrhizobium sp. Ai1a-2]